MALLDLQSNLEEATMVRQILNRSVIKGAVIYGIVHAILIRATVIMLYLNMYSSDGSKRGVIIVGLIVLLICAFITGWLVARASIRNVLPSKLVATFGFAALCGGLATLLGQLPNVLLFGGIISLFLGLESNIVELVVSFLLGALGGVLCFWIRNKRAARSKVAANVQESVESAPRVDE